MSEGARDGIRLNRYLALCGVGARRKADAYIAEGRVAVNGKTVSEPGLRVCPGDCVTFDGRGVSPAKHVYIILNKPRGVVSAVSDKREKTVLDILPERFAGLNLFPVGRLDKESEGLIILTNDGMFAQELMHPSKGTLKTYEVELRAPLAEELLIMWAGGVEAEGRLLKPVSVRRLARRPMRCWFEVVLGEGLKREIRLMARALGNDVRRLIRRKIGRLELGLLPSGECLSVACEDLRRYIKEGKIV